jgi:hypothetical protein
MHLCWRAVVITSLHSLKVDASMGSSACALVMERLREGAEDQESCVAGGQMDKGCKEAVQW